MHFDPESATARLAAEIRRLRREAGLSQQRLAKAVHYTRAYIGMLEKPRASLPAHSLVESLDQVLQANGELVELRISAEREHAAPGRPEARSAPLPDTYFEVMDAIRRSEVTDATLEYLHLTTDELCCQYAWRDAGKLREEAIFWLGNVKALLAGPCSLGDHRELLVVAGWLSLLIGCLDYDMGDERGAEFARRSAFEVGKETNHGEIQGWSFEMGAWFALTQGNYQAVANFARGGLRAAPHSSVAVQLTALDAKATARMGARVDRILDDGFSILSGHDTPSRPDHHFVIDPTKWAFYAMDCYRISRQNDKSAMHAREVLRLSKGTGGVEKSPMRAAEAKLTLAALSLRDGDLEGAADYTAKAFDVERKSINSLLLVADEVNREAKSLRSNDPAIREIGDQITSAQSRLLGN
ncbi:helix-turn-helix domain-containing protein [Amycolatopsis magusensis]|uniref:helix-turn-helix domain-containing protein n=1 Tax=Amycolatopsis magusensis TaxID=882444 RepID=UPI003C2AFC1B